MLDPETYTIETVLPTEAAASEPGVVRLHRATHRLDGPRRLIKSGMDFLEGFTPPDYLWDGLLQRRFCYSLTAQTGAGKTALSLLLSAHVASGTPLAGCPIEQGRVLYFAGENPDDVRMRWMAMAERMGFSPAELPVYFVDGRQNLDQIERQIREEVEQLGGVSLVVFDTRAAFFHGEQENDNVEAGAEARRFRRFTTLAGGPVVLVPSHPVKNAGPDNLLPRGGGAFLAEVDGNLTLAASPDGPVLHWQGKFRGQAFDPMGFKLESVTAHALRDSKGRPIPTVMAVEAAPGQAGAQPASSGRNRNRNLPDSPALLLRIVRDALLDAGEFQRGSMIVPHDRRSLPRSRLEPYLRREGYWDDCRPQNSLRASLSKDLRTLKNRGFLGVSDGHVWVLE